MPITAVIIDDEPDCAMYLSYLIAKLGGEIQLLGIAESVDEGILLIQDKNPELVFLDISMPPKTGFDLLSAIPDKNFEVIFCTSFGERAIDAIRVAAFDYLLKPVEFPLLEASIQRLKEKKLKNTNPEQLTFAKQVYLNGYDSIMISTMDSVELISLEDILYVEANGNYAYFYLKDGSTVISSKGLGHYVDLLPENMFFHCSRSASVNTNYIQRFTKGINAAILLKNGKEIPLSARRKDAFINFLKRKAMD